jgi:carboxymethylenebutenolidase
MQAELNSDLAGTMATMVDEPPPAQSRLSTGCQGADGVATFYSIQLIGQFFPPDVEFISISLTVDGERLVDELVICYTHTETIGHLLPGMAAT